MIFLTFLLDDGRIRIRILEAQKGSESGSTTLQLTLNNYISPFPLSF
jgi:hypothetical protein